MRSMTERPINISLFKRTKAMGCDIHLHTEIRIDGEWHHYNTPDVNRSYALFTKMANVRNYDREIEPISRPKGLPPNISRVTALDVENWDGDGHSHSWLSFGEICELYDWLESEGSRPYEYFGFFFGNDYNAFKNYPDDVEHLKELGIEDVRFVFWFDN